MSEQVKSVQLKVLEAYTRDVGRGICRMDYDAMDKLDVSTGEVVKIQAKDQRFTVAKVLPLYPSDEGREILRMDGLIRNNAHVNLKSESSEGSVVVVTKTRFMPADVVTVKELEAAPPIDGHFLAEALDSVPVTKGDNVMIPYFGGRLTFEVIDVGQKWDVVVCIPKTQYNVEGHTPPPKPIKEICVADGLEEINLRLREGWKVIKLQMTPQALQTTHVAAIMERVNQ